MGMKKSFFVFFLLHTSIKPIFVKLKNKILVNVYLVRTSWCVERFFLSESCKHRAYFLQYIVSGMRAHSPQIQKVVFFFLAAVLPLDVVVSIHILSGWLETAILCSISKISIKTVLTTMDKMTR